MQTHVCSVLHLDNVLSSSFPLPFLCGIIHVGGGTAQRRIKPLTSWLIYVSIGHGWNVTYRVCMFHKGFLAGEESVTLHKLLAACWHQVTGREKAGRAQLPVACCWSPSSLSGSCSLRTVLKLLWKSHLREEKGSFELRMRMLCTNIIKATWLRAMLWQNELARCCGNKY